MKRISFKKALCLGLIFVMVMGVLAGCGKKESAEETETEPETYINEEDIDPNEIAVRIGDDYTVDAKTLMFYYLLYKTRFEKSYAITDWSVKMDETRTYGQYLKELVRDQVNQLVYLVSIAEDNNQEVDPEKIEELKENAKTTFEFLPAEDREIFDITEEFIHEILVKDALAGLGYNIACEEIKKNLTEEELDSCKYKHVQQILLSTVVNRSGSEAETDEDGNIIKEAVPAVSDEEWDAQRKELAEELRAKAIAGEDFGWLSVDHTDDRNVDYYINNEGVSTDGVSYVPEFIDACLALKEGEVSEVFKTVYGYHIVKCIEEVNEHKTQGAIDQLANTKVYEEFQVWLDHNPYEYFEKWQQLRVKNPEIELPEIEETDSELETK